MEIRFSSRAHPANMVRFVNDAAGHYGIAVDNVRVRGLAVRFRLLDADESEHDQVIAKLFELDPNAVVRTARAVYESKADFEAQRKARVG